MQDWKSTQSFLLWNRVFHVEKYVQPGIISVYVYFDVVQPCNGTNGKTVTLYYFVIGYHCDGKKTLQSVCMGRWPFSIMVRTFQHFKHVLKSTFWFGGEGIKKKQKNSWSILYRNFIHFFAKQKCWICDFIIVWMGRRKCEKVIILNRHIVIVYAIYLELWKSYCILCNRTRLWY